jgi:hypothetical protein
MTKSDEAMAQVIAAAKSQLSQEVLDQIEEYLRYGEIELAFEGLVTSLRRIGFDAAPDILSDLAYLARNLELENYPDGKGTYW